MASPKIEDTRRFIYLCGWGDGDSHGRYLWEEEAGSAAAGNDPECPICGYPKSYHDCRWWIVVEDA